MKNVNKIGSQITVALVCCILGFILTFQFKQVNRQEKTEKSPGNSADISLEIQQLTKQKKELETKIDDLQSKIKNYEASAGNTNTTNEQLLKDLKDSRVASGLVDVKGEGIIITFVPKSNVFDNTNDINVITPEMLASLTNCLIAYGAEAVSINDIRMSSRTGIIQSGKLLKIGSSSISPLQKITVKAIGNKNKMEAFTNFPGEFDEYKGYTISKEKSDDITIQKSDDILKFNYAKTVDEK